MKLTKRTLQQLIREELTDVLAQQEEQVGVGTDWAEATINWAGPGSFGRVVRLEGNVGGNDFILNNQQIYGDQKLRDMSDWQHSPEKALRDVLQQAGINVSTVGVKVTVKEY